MTLKPLLIVTLAALPCFGATPVAPYHQKADKIVHILKREGARPNREAIAMTLKAIDVNLKRYFPHGEFSREDWIAIAMQESRFDPACRGTNSDTGIFQVLGSVPEIKKNTEDAFRVMLSKFKEHHHDKRKAIVAYNGYRVRNGKLVDVYYRAVMKQRRRIANV
jgi:hypothetical protein